MKLLMFASRMKTLQVSLAIISLALAGCKGTQPTGPQTASPNQQAAPVINIDPSTAGSVTGVISLQGSAPQVPGPDMSQDPACPNDSQPSDTVGLKRNQLAQTIGHCEKGLARGRLPGPRTPA